MPEPVDDLWERFQAYQAYQANDSPRPNADPPVPARDLPDVAEAEARLLRSAVEREQLSRPGMEGAAAGAQFARKVRARPDAVPAEPTLLEQAGIALAPKQVREDRRPERLSEAPGYILDQAKRTILATGDPLGIARGIARAAGADVPDDEEGLPAEGQALWALRVLGSTVPAVLQETIKRSPAPDVQGAAKLAQEGAFAEAASRFFTLSTVSEQALGVPANHHQRVRREHPVADWAQGVLEKIERGEGFEADVQESFRRRFGEEWENTGWWLGFVVDLATNWEGAALKAGSVLPRAVARAGALAEVAPGLGGVQRYVRAIRGTEVDGAEIVGARLGELLERGEIDLEDLPPAIREQFEEIALNEYDLTARELLEASGLSVRTRGAVDPQLEDLRRREAEARKALADQGFAERGVRTRDKAGQVKVKRKHLPEFPQSERQPVSQTEVWEAVRRLYDRERAAGTLPAQGYGLSPGFGFRRIRGALGQTPDDDLYVLRNRDGDVIRRGTFLDLVSRMRRAPRDGDEIWYGTQRRVARWRRTIDKQNPEPAISADRWFASDAERAIVSELKKQGLAGTKQLRRAADTSKEGKAIGRALAEVLSRAPGAGRVKTPVGQAVVDAARIAMIRRLEADRFRMLPTGALVPARDHSRYMAAVDRVLRIKPAEVARLYQGQGSASAVARVEALAKRYEVTLPGGRLGPRQWLEIRNAAVREVAGVYADTRYRVQGTAGWAERALLAVADLHLDRRRVGRVAKLLKRSPLAWVSEAFLEDKLGRMPAAVRSRWKELQVRLGRNLDELVREYSALGQGTRTGKLLQLVRRYTVVHPQDVALSRALIEAPTSELVEQLVARLPQRPVWAEFKSENTRRDMAVLWAQRLRDTAAIQGREWVRSVLTASGRDVSRTDIADAIAQLDREVALKVYGEVFEDGVLNGPALSEALSAIKVAPAAWDETEALVVHTVRMRAEALVDETMDEIMGRLVVAESDPRREALRAVLEDKHRIWDAKGNRYAYLFPEAQITWALGKLRDWGVDPGSTAALELRQIGRRQGVVPRYLADDIGGMVASAQVDSREVYGSEAFDLLLRSFKEWTTHGVVMPNAAYFTGQMLGMWPTLLTTRGLSGAASTASQLFAHPLETSKLLVRLAGGPLFRTRGAGEVVFSADGAVYTLEHLEEVARRYGLEETPTSYETGQRFRALVAADGDDYRLLDPRRLLMPVKWWQNKLRLFGGAADQAARVATFIAEVKRGTPLEQAAEAARGATLDFRAMTTWEARYMRRIFTFYAFMRKNSDAYVRALVNNPSVVLGQMRLAHASLMGSGLSGVELANMREEDLARLVLYDDDDVVNDNGRVHPLYRLNRLVTTPMGVLEVMLTLRSILRPSELLDDVNPALQSLSIVLAGRKLDRDFDGPHANRTPPWLVEFPGLGPIVRDLFGIGPVPIRADEDLLLADDDATAELGSGEPAVWAAGGDPTLTPEQRRARRTRWQLFRTWVSRPMNTAEQLAEATGWQQIDPTLTQRDAALAAALGLRWLPVANEQEAVRRGLSARARRMREAEEELAIPERPRLR